MKRKTRTKRTINKSDNDYNIETKNCEKNSQKRIKKTLNNEMIEKKNIIIDRNVDKTEDSIESNVRSNDLSPKRLRKQSFVSQMYCKESDERSAEEVMESVKSEEPIVSSQQFRCLFCEKTFETKVRQLRHLRVDHKIDKPIVESLPFPEFIESNCVSNGSDGSIRCGKCCFQTSSEAEMILHCVNHNVIVMNGSDCEEEPKQRFTSKLKCPACERVLSRPLLRRHVYIHTSEKAFRCDECRKEFSSSRNLTTHKRNHKTITESEVKCQICCVELKSKKSLQKHQLIHAKDRPKRHVCGTCGQAFYDRESLKAHTYRIHLPKNVRKFKCDFNGCRYTSLYQHQMLEHQKVHSEEKPYSCDQCEYTAKSKWTFKKHYRKHTNERPFKCPHCEYASSLSSNLTRHLRIHTGSKPFKCPYCSYSCNNHENLRKHVLNTRKHRGLHLYNCMHCMFATNVFSELRQHMERTHNDIYTNEQIDRMISSIYHKQEDNTTVVPRPATPELRPATPELRPATPELRPATPEPNQKEAKTDGNRTKSYSLNLKTHSNEATIKWILINPNEELSDESNEMILSNDLTEDMNDRSVLEIQSNALEDNKQTNHLTINNSKSNVQNNSEIILLNSDVLEAQEVCVGERLAPKV